MLPHSFRSGTARAGQKGGIMRSAGRATAGAAVTVTAALVLFLASCGHGGSHPPATAGTGSASTAQDGSAARSSAVAAARHADPLSGAAGSSVAGRSGTVLAAVYDIKTGQSW